MTDRDLFLLLLAVLYLGECSTIVGRLTVVCRSWWLGDASPAYASGMLGAFGRGLVVGNPLPPLGRTAPVSFWPVSPSPEGVLSWTAVAVHPDGRPDQSVNWRPFAAIAKVAAEEKRIRVNDADFAVAATPAQARAMAGLIRDLAAAAPADRAAAVAAALDRSLDDRAATDRLAAYRKAAAPVLGLANALWAVLFVGVPLAAISGWWVTGWPWLALALIGLMVAIAVTAHRAERTLFPRADPERWLRTFLYATVPFMSARAADYLALSLFEGLHPLAAVRATCGPEAFRGFAARFLLDAAEPLRPLVPGADAPAREAEAWFRTKHREAAERFLLAAGEDPAALTAPPSRQSADARTYCPRCRSQYVSDAAACASCGGVSLVPFAVPGGAA